jgi:hypothetical protein
VKRVLIAAAFAASTLAGTAQAAVNVSVAVGQPGFYGVIDIGNAPPPVVYSPQPVVIQPVPVALPPLYLRVPPGHRKHWGQHCAEYNACGRPVYFVDDNWYTNVYAPHYQQHHDYYEGRRDFEDRREGRGDHGDHDHGEHGHGDHDRH